MRERAPLPERTGRNGEMHGSEARGARSGLCTLSLVLTGRCNLSCAYCYRASTAGRSMPPSLAREAIDFLLESPVPEQTLLFTGGEPLLEFPLLREAILHARQACPPGKRLRIVLNTNGMLLGPRTLSFLAEQQVEVQLSFDGVAEAQSLRDPRSFARLDRLLLTTRRSQPHFYRRSLSVAMTVGPATVPFLAASIRYFLARRVGEIRLGPVLLRRTEPTPGLLDLLDAQFREVVEASLLHFRETGETPLALFRESPDRGQAGRPRDLLCHAGAGECLALGPTGEGSVCPLFLSGDFPASGPLSGRRAGLLLGRFGDEDFRARLASMPRAVAESGLFRRETKRSSSGECSTCESASLCWACPASILLDQGNDDPDRIPDLQCALSRVAAAHRARFLERRGPRFSEDYAEMLRSVRLVPEARDQPL
jgi:uncharacterized Fe-S cluster-containing radical SAM superfamily protein